MRSIRSGYFANESVDGKNWKVRRFNDNSGVRLSPTTNEVSNSVYTIALLFRFSAPTGYTRIVDFKNGTSDYGLYADSGNLYFYPWSSGTSAKVGTTFAQVVLIRDSNKRVIGYVDGQQQFSFTDSTNDGVISNNVLRFFQDNTSGGVTTEASPGAVARLRLFNKALTADQVKNLGQLPASPCSTT